MSPDGFEGFRGQIDEAIAVALNGVYGIRCSPHLGIGMGMVMLVKLGEAAGPDGFVDALKGRAGKRFGEFGARAGVPGPAP